MIHDSDEIWYADGELYDTQMVVERPKSKPEIVFQYGGRLFSEIGSSNILAVD